MLSFLSNVLGTADTAKSNFLGFTFKGTKLRWPNKAYRESKRRVKEQWVNIHYPVTAR